jgi:hypothetical protein
MKKIGLSLGLAATLLCQAQQSFGQEEQTPFQKYFADCTSGRSADVPKEVCEDSKSARRWLSSSEKPLMSSGKRATCAIQGIFRIAMYDKEDKSTGRIAVNLLTGRLEQGGFNDYIVDRMDDLPRNFFLDIHLERIAALAKKKETQHRDKMIKLLVGLNYEAGYSIAYDEMQNPSISKYDLFVYHTYFAKRGSDESIKWLNEKLATRKVDSESINTVVPLIIATRQKSLIQWVVAGLDDSEKRCDSSDDRIFHCGYLILEYLAPVIKDFPIKADDSGLITNDANQALVTAREWFRSNPNYVIL